jgi:hypothetical protein
MGKPLCAAGFFDYFERTYRNRITVRAKVNGYESPRIVWTINGQPVPLLGRSFEVDATWDLPPISKYSPIPLRKPTATLGATVYSPAATELTIYVGPNEGNVEFGVGCGVIESFDSGTGAGSSTRNASILVSAKDQEIVWGQAYNNAKKACEHATHLAAGPKSGIGLPQPGDPPDLAQILVRLLLENGPNSDARIRKAAELVRNFSNELADTLASHAQQPK